MKVFNHTGRSIEEIKALPVVGIVKNNWRQRYVTLYQSHDPEKLYMLGVTFDNQMTVASHESIGLNEQQALNMFPRTLVRD